MKRILYFAVILLVSISVLASCTSGPDAEPASDISGAATTSSGVGADTSVPVGSDISIPDNDSSQPKPDQSAPTTEMVNGASTEISGNSNTSTPEFFNDIGKTLSQLKNEHPEGEFTVSLVGLPDSAAACFGEPGAEYAFYFFGGQSGDFEKAMNEGEDQLTCAGFITTANVLFPDMEDDMSFEDFFALIGVEDYEYFGDDTTTLEGWLSFTYHGVEVMVNTNELNGSGGWNFTGAEIVKRNAPVSIADPEILHTNQDLAEPVMFD